MMFHLTSCIWLKSEIKYYPVSYFIILSYLILFVAVSKSVAGRFPFDTMAFGRGVEQKSASPQLHLSEGVRLL